jgi:hypothetical protein
MPLAVVKFSHRVIRCGRSAAWEKEQGKRQKANVIRQKEEKQETAYGIW